MTPETSNNNNRLSEVFFQAKPCLRSHIHALLRQGEEYLKMLRYMCRSGTIGPCSSATKARILAALHVCNKHKAVVEFLPFCEIPDVNKALHLLDRPRKIRQLEAKIKAIETEHPHLVESTEDKKKKEEEEKETKTDADGKVVKKRKKKKRRKIDSLRQARQQLVAEAACSGTPACQEAHDNSAVEEMINAGMSVSGALARKIQAWTKGMPQDYLEFVLLGMPLEPWKELADLVHLRPSDFVVPYFLEYVFGKKPEGRNFVTQMKDLLDGIEGTDASTMLEKYFGVAGEFPTQLALQYPLLRRYPALLSQTKVVEDLAGRIPLDTVIWWYEEFHRKGNCDGIIKERLGGSSSSEDVMKHFQQSKVTFGKLIERIMTCRRLGASFAEDLVPLAAARLEELKTTWSSSSSNRMAVFGDASGSMETAIEAATIFASMVSACFDGELSFFDYTVMPSPHLKPSTVQQALEVCSTVKVRGATCNAAGLWPYYEQKKVMDTFVMVTDEGENQAVQGRYRFAELFSMYLKEVNPKAKLVIARVGRGDRYFQSTLENHGIDYTVVYLDENRPDHAKFDALLGQLSVLSSTEEAAATDTDGAMEVEETKDESAATDNFVVV